MSSTGFADLEQVNDLLDEALTGAGPLAAGAWRPIAREGVGVAHAGASMRLMRCSEVHLNTDCRWSSLEWVS